MIDGQLHGFGDASESAYGGVIYLRTLYEDTTVVINLVMAKARVAPGLELGVSCTIAQILVQVAEDLHVSKQALYGWTDSAVVLGWLKKCRSVLKGLCFT